MLNPKNSHLKSNWSIESQRNKIDQGFFFDLMSKNDGIKINGFVSNIFLFQLLIDQIKRIISFLKFYFSEFSKTNQLAMKMISNSFYIYYTA